jgi:alpha-mannosidase
MTDMMDLYGIGDHGGGPTRAILDEGFHWADAFDAAEGDAEVCSLGLRRPFLDD